MDPSGIVPQFIRDGYARTSDQDVREDAATLDAARSIMKYLAARGDTRSEYISHDILQRYAWLKQLLNERERAARQ